MRLVFHTCLTYVPAPEKALMEAFRVLRPDGRLAVLDGDYSTTSVATGDHDPLQACADAAMAGLVHDRWFVRRLPPMLSSAGFRIERLDSHGWQEARRRVDGGRFFGFIAFARLIASKST